MNGTLMEEAGGPFLKLTNTESEIGNLEIEACSGVVALEGPHKVKGSLILSPQMGAGAERGSWLLPAGKSSILVGGSSAKVSGEMSVETLGGEIVTLG
jgi:hypothetical protein